MPVFKLLPSIAFNTSFDWYALEDSGPDSCAHMLFYRFLTECDGEFARFECLHESEGGIIFKIANMLRDMKFNGYANASLSVAGDFEGSVVNLSMDIQKDVMAHKFDVCIKGHIKDPTQMPPKLFGSDSAPEGVFNKIKTVNFNVQGHNPGLMHQALYGSEGEDSLMGQISKQMAEKIAKLMDDDIVNMLTGNGKADTNGYANNPYTKNFLKMKPGGDLSLDDNDLGKIKKVTISDDSWTNAMWVDEVPINTSKVPKGPKKSGYQKKFNIPKSLGLKKGK